MVTYQADRGGKNRPRWPMLPGFVLFHAQMKVVVAMATDALPAHPECMLCVLLVASAADLAYVVTRAPNQHTVLNRYRVHGGVFSVWSCVCAFVALWIDDRTKTFSVALFCGGYATYHAAALAQSLYAMPVLERGRWIRTRSVAVALIGLCAGLLMNAIEGTFLSFVVVVVASVVCCCCLGHERPCGIDLGDGGSTAPMADQPSPPTNALLVGRGMLRETLDEPRLVSPLLVNGGSE
jgi:hypothetical protein